MRHIYGYHHLCSCACALQPGNRGIPRPPAHPNPLKLIESATETNAYGCGSQSQRQAYPIASTSPHIRHCFPCQHVRLRGKNHKKMQRKNENLPLQKGSRLRKSKYQSKMRGFLSDKSPVVPMKSAKLFRSQYRTNGEKLSTGTRTLHGGHLR